MPKAHPATMPRGSAGLAAQAARALKMLIITSRDAVGEQKTFDSEQWPGDAELRRTCSVIGRRARRRGEAVSGRFQPGAISDAHAHDLFAR
ncbi:hypothetical protein BIWAKO_01883 [Bosea sp. BIWAKO-01]|nr:hypothetical protein BIWAKO_01883 [Bosea sp. BIWAKO-01]